MFFFASEKLFAQSSWCISGRHHTKDGRSSNTGIGAERRDNIRGEGPWAVAAHGRPRWANIICFTIDYAIATRPCTNTVIGTKRMCDWWQGSAISASAPSVLSIAVGTATADVNFFLRLISFLQLVLVRLDSCLLKHYTHHRSLGSLSVYLLPYSHHV